MQEWWRVLKPEGSCFVNLGDKRAGSGGHNNAGLSRNGITGSLHGGKPPPSAIGKNETTRAIAATRRNAPDRYNQASFGRTKSKMLIPHRFAIGCEDGLADPQGIGWVMRQEIVWCLSGGAKVYARTPSGDRPMMIRDLYRSYRPENVQLWNGQQWTQCLGWSQTPADKTALELELRSGERIGCTRNHQWPTQRGLLRADQLTIGDVLETTKLPEPRQVEHAGLPDEDIGWFVGLFLAEGSRSGTMMQIAGHQDETLRMERLKRIAAAYDGRAAVYRVSENGVTCNLSGTVLSGILDRYVSRGTAATKRLTVHAWQRSNEFLAAVMEGYLDGDGHFDAKNDRWRIGFTDNDEWASDLRTLAARLGTKISLRRAIYKVGGREFPGWRGEWRWTHKAHHNARAGGQIVAIRASRARDFYDIGVAEEPHLFALASGVLTHNSKLNGLPESVTDRHRDSHEYIFHFTKQERYFAAMDEIRQAHARAWDERNGGSFAKHGGKDSLQFGASGNSGAYPKPNPLGALPGSVWPMASEPLLIPQWAKDKYGLGDHFAAFPTELPRKLILGFSPSGICVECGEPRRPMVDKRNVELVAPTPDRRIEALISQGYSGKGRGNQNGNSRTEATITGYACACPIPDAPTRPSVILDPFGGTGTVAMVAKGLGRIGISNDLSQDYCNLARWRIEESGHGKKAEQRTWHDRQETLL